MLQKTKTFLEMIKFEHTIFALPFAYMGAILGAISLRGELPSWGEIGWITLAMVGARSAAMGLNRLIDKKIDAANPRTAGRAIPAGLLSVFEVLIFIIISFVLLFWAASQLNVLSMQLLPIAVFFLVFYSYTKRFTWACHLILGMTIGLAPLGGWVAVTGQVDFTSLVFYISVACWIAGFDIIYACQDFEFDKQRGVYSIPARFGLAGALWIARSLHVLTLAGFLYLMSLASLSWIYAIGMVITSAILYYEHHLVRPNDLSRLNTAFFTMNGILSVVVFTFTLIDVAVRYL